MKLKVKRMIVLLSKYYHANSSEKSKMEISSHKLLKMRKQFNMKRKTARRCIIKKKKIDQS